MSVLEAAAAAAVHELMDRDPGPAPGFDRSDDPRRSGSSPATSRTRPGRFQLHSQAIDVTEAGVDTEFADFVSDRFGIMRLSLTTAADPRLQLVSLRVGLRNRMTALEPVSVHALERLFRSPFAAPIVILRNETVVLYSEATAAGGAGQLRAALQGLTGAQLDAASAAGRLATTRRGDLVEPILLAKHVTVPAGATSFPIAFDSRGVDLAFRRIAASTDSDAHDHALGLTLRGSDGIALDQLSPAGYADVFRDTSATPMLRFPRSFPAEFTVDNPTADAVPLSVVVEAYEVGALEVAR